jgi:hypothetical protein
MINKYYYYYSSNQTPKECNWRLFRGKNLYGIFTFHIENEYFYAYLDAHLLLISGLFLRNYLIT